MQQADAEQKTADDAQRAYIIGDLHLGHKNIIAYCSRPFTTVEEMNETLVGNWNRTVRPTDKVYFLGDLAFGRTRPMEQWAARLNGDIVFIKGNHDRSKRLLLHKQLAIDHDGIDFLLVHNPMAAPPTWDGWIVHGHTHNNHLDQYPFINAQARRVNVSCELIRYTPLALDDLVTLLPFGTRRTIDE